jgi:hypothetical protein
VTRLPKLPRALVAVATLIAGLALAPATLAHEPTQDQDAARRDSSRHAMQAFQAASAFAEAGRIDQAITFDDVSTGTSMGNPAWLGQVNVAHSTAAALTTNADAYIPVSSPNVLVPTQLDGALALGDTTITFNKNTRRVGLVLIVPLGSNEATVWTTAVTATDTKEQSVTILVSFQGVVGEQQFVGFESHHKLLSVTFGPATKSDGGSAVLAIDDLSVD